MSLALSCNTGEKSKEDKEMEKKMKAFVDSLDFTETSSGSDEEDNGQSFSKKSSGDPSGTLSPLLESAEAHSDCLSSYQMFCDNSKGELFGGNEAGPELTEGVELQDVATLAMVA